MADKNLIDPEDVINEARERRTKDKNAVPLLMTLLNVNKINKIYEENSHKEGEEFVNALLEAFEINFEFNSEQLSRIPQKGPFIIVSNHPFGGVDSLLLLHLILKARPDFKITANALFVNAEPLRKYSILNPWDLNERATDYMRAAKAAFHHLESGGGLALFPAGEVSGFNYYLMK